MLSVVDWANELRALYMGVLGAGLCPRLAFLYVFVPATLSLLAGATWGLYEGDYRLTWLCFGDHSFCIFGAHAVTEQAERLTARYSLLRALDKVFSADAFKW